MNLNSSYNQTSQFNAACPLAWNPSELYNSLESNSEIPPVNKPIHANAAPKTPPSNNLENRRISARMKRLSSRVTAQTPEDPKYTFGLAITPWEHLACYNLLYEQYLSFGYTKEHLNRVRITPWNCKKNSYTFVAKRGDKVVGTVSLIEDSFFQSTSTSDANDPTSKLPADQLFAEETANLRNPNRHIVEVAGMATCNGQDKTEIVMNLIRAITTFSRNKLKANDWVITVNPRHVRYYEKVMMFIELGRIEAYQSVNGAPAVLMHLDLEAMPFQYKQKYSRHSGARNLYKFLFNEDENSKHLPRLLDQLEQRNKYWKETEGVLAELLKSNEH